MMMKVKKFENTFVGDRRGTGRGHEENFDQDVGVRSKIKEKVS